METKNYAGVQLEVNNEGYLVDPSKWTNDVAIEIAKEEGIELTEKHFEVINLIRNKFINGESLSIRGIGKSGIIEIKEFYRLFQGAPLKKATKIAGVPKPESCI